jgi:hypothetical protein
MSPRDRLPLLLLALAGSLGMHLVAQQLGLVPALHGLAPVVVVGLTCAAVVLGRDNRWKLGTVAAVQLPVAALLELVVHSHAGVTPSPSALVALLALHVVGVVATSGVADLLVPDHVPAPIQLPHGPSLLCPSGPLMVGSSMLDGTICVRGPPSTACPSPPSLRS